MTGRYSYQDMKLLFNYLEKHCEGSYVRFSISHTGTLEVQTKTKFEQDIKITIFQEETRMFPIITREERLTND